MKIGRYDVSAIQAGNFGLDGGAMFGVVPKALWSKSNPADDQNRINLATRCLLLRGTDRNILVDTGNGDKWEEKYRNIYKITPQEAGLPSELARFNLTPDDITDVILTHLHFDHAGGATRYHENGDLIPAFPNATYYVQKRNWEWANNPTEKDGGSYLSENFIPLREHRVLEFVDGAGELFPGITLLTFDGHTQGQQLPLVNDGESMLFYCADLVPTKAHFSIPWVMGYDNFPLTTIEEKKRTFRQATEEKWIMVLEHDPETEAVRIHRTEHGYQPDQKVTLIR